MGYLIFQTLPFNTSLDKAEGSELHAGIFLMSLVWCSEYLNPESFTV